MPTGVETYRAALEFMVREFGSGVALVIVLGTIFFYVLRSYHRHQLGVLTDANREAFMRLVAAQQQFQEHNERQSRRFEDQIDTLSRRHEGSLRDLERQFRDHARGVEQSVDALHAAVATLTTVVNRILQDKPADEEPQGEAP